MFIFMSSISTSFYNPSSTLSAGFPESCGEGFIRDILCRIQCCKLSHSLPIVWLGFLPMFPCPQEGTISDDGKARHWFMSITGGYWMVLLLGVVLSLFSFTKTITFYFLPYATCWPSKSWIVTSSIFLHIIYLHVHILHIFM